MVKTHRHKLTHPLSHRNTQTHSKKDTHQPHPGHTTLSELPLFPTGKWGKRNFIWCLSLDCMYTFLCDITVFRLFICFAFSTTFTSKTCVTYHGSTTGGKKQSFQRHSLVSNTVQHVPEELSWAGIRWLKPLAYDRHRFHPRGTVYPPQGRLQKLHFIPSWTIKKGLLK